MSLFLVIALALAGQAAAAPPPKPAPASAPAPARPLAPADLSWDDADQLATTLARIDRRLRSGRPAASGTLVVTERQLNSYVNLALGPKIPAGVSDLRLQLVRDGLGATANVDLDRVRGKVPNGTGGILALLSGTVPVELHGRLVAADGTGRIEVQDASVGGVGLPPALVAQLVSLATKNAQRPNGFDIQAPFALPWKAKQVRFESGRALVDFFR